MRVLVLTDYEAFGGAGIAASRLARALSSAEHDVAVGATQFGGSGFSDLERIDLRATDFASKVSRRLSAGAGTRRSKRLVEEILIDYVHRWQPDVVSVHNIHGAEYLGWSLDMVRICAQSCPTIWTLHDMWSFTGGCSYAGECKSYSTGCGTWCKCLNEYPKPTSDKLSLGWQLRMELIAENQGLHAVTPSRWLADRAVEGVWPSERVRVIRNGIPLEVFHPIPRVEARRALNVPEQGLVVIASAIDLNERRKGGRLLFSALKRLAFPIHLITTGQPLKEPPAAFGITQLGTISDGSLMNAALNAADLLIHPATEDNFPNVIVEAFAAGTPVAAFATGGVPEVVHEGSTGWLSQDFSAHGLSRAIMTGLSTILSGVTLRDRCRAVAERDMGLKTCGQRYGSFFEELAAPRIGR